MALTKITGEGVGAVDNLTVGTTAGDAGASLTINKSPVAAHGNPLVQVGGSTFTSGGYYTVGLGFTNSTYTEPPAEIAYVSQSDSGGTKGDIVFGTRDVTTNTAVSTRMTIAAGGNVGIGNSSPSHLLDATVSSDSATARFGTTDTSGNNHGTVIISNGGTGDAMLRFDYEGSNTDRARIGVTASGQQLEFYTAGNNERMQINSNGEIIFQKPNNQFATLTIRGADTNGYYNVLFEGSSSNGYKVLFKHGTSSVGSIITTSSATSYNTSSDHRLKENVADMSGAIARVKQLSPKRFSWIVDDLDDANVDGFLAHEAQTVVPEAVHGTHNQVDDEGEPVYQGIDQSKLVPLLTAALKESIAKIETLEAKVAALEGN
jgi:hypothetical protein